METLNVRLDVHIYKKNNFFFECFIKVEKMHECQPAENIILHLWQGRQKIHRCINYF